MSNFDPALLEMLSEGVIQSDAGTITFMNRAARLALPQLEEGQPLPDLLLLPPNAPAHTGEIDTEQGRWSFSATQCQEKQFILLRPVPPAERLTATQTEGLLRQLRSLMGDMIVQLAPVSDPEDENYVGGGLVRSYYRLFRLVDNADFLNRPQEELSFHPTTIDLAGMCSRLCLEASDLLRDAGITLCWKSSFTSLPVWGDSALLQRLLLELITNGSKSVPGGSVVVSLTRYGNHALVSVGDSGSPEQAQQLLAAMSGNISHDAMPKPGQGAGLGLAVARQIARLHGGSLVALSKEQGVCVAISLPIRGVQATVESPRVITDGGLHPLLVSMSDVLPIPIYEMEGLD